MTGNQMSVTLLVLFVLRLLRKITLPSLNGGLLVTTAPLAVSWYCRGVGVRSMTGSGGCMGSLALLRCGT